MYDLSKFIVGIEGTGLKMTKIKTALIQQLL